MKSSNIIFASILSIGSGQVAAVGLHVYLAKQVHLVDYADYVQWAAVLVISQVIATLRLELLTNQIMDQDEQIRHFKNSIMLSVLVSILLLAGLLLINLIDQKVSYFFIGSFVVALQCQAVITHGQSLLVAREELSRLAILRFLTYFTVPVVQIAIFMTFNATNAMILGHVIASAASATILLPYLGKKVIGGATLWAFALRNMRHMAYATPSALINTLSRQLPLLLIGQVGGDRQTALFGLSIRVVGAPLGILGIGMVDIYKVSVRRFQQNRNTATFKLGFMFSVIGSATVGVIVVNFAQLLVSMFMDTAWVGLDETIILLLPLFLMRFVTSPMSYMMVVTSRQNWDIMWQISWLLTVVSVFFFSTGYEATLVIYSIAGVVFYAVYGVISYLSYLKFLEARDW